jgi:hypothetical protein
MRTAMNKRSGMERKQTGRAMVSRARLVNQVM